MTSPIFEGDCSVMAGDKLRVSEYQDDMSELEFVTTEGQHSTSVGLDWRQVTELRDALSVWLDAKHQAMQGRKSRPE